MFDQNVTSIMKTMWFLLGPQHRNDKKWKIIEEIKIKNFADFFRYDVMQERAWFRADLTPIFRKDNFY